MTLARFSSSAWTAHGRPAVVPHVRLVWRPGDVIPLGERSLRVVGVRDDDADQAPCWSLKNTSEPPTSERRRLVEILSPKMTSPRPSLNRRVPSCGRRPLPGERWSLRSTDLGEVAVYCPECDGNSAAGRTETPASVRKRLLQQGATALSEP